MPSRTPNGRRRRRSYGAAALCVGVLIAGCDASKSANITLRKQLQQQQETIDGLERQHAADEARRAAATRPASGPALLAGPADTLYTVHGIRFGRLTGQARGNLVVHLIPTDQDGEDFKASGTITVDVFDLADNGRQVGRVAFGPAEAMKLWNGTGLRYEYVVPCILSDHRDGDLTVRVTFTDALTGRLFDAQQVVKSARE